MHDEMAVDGSWFELTLTCAGHLDCAGCDAVTPAIDSYELLPATE